MKSGCLLEARIMITGSTNLRESVSHEVYVVPNHQILVEGLGADNSFLVNQPNTTNLLIDKK